MNNDQIVKYCRAQEPDVIYIAIGCAQGHHAPGDPLASPQQHPPCIAALGGRQLCILIDPHLETPIRAGAGTEKPETQIIHASDTLCFIPVRRNFLWTSLEDQHFIKMLCYIAIHSTTRIIVQDYSGQNIHTFYPLALFGPPLLRKVLFDFTYRDGGCYVDLSAVKILMHKDGTFVQPLYESIASSLSFASPDQRIFIIGQRHNTMWCYVQRLHRIQSGVEEVRDWCTTDLVLQHMTSLCSIYATPLRTDNTALEQLMMAYLFDLCETVGDFMPYDDALQLVRGSGKEYQELLELLKTIILEQNVRPQ